MNTDLLDKGMPSSKPKEDLNNVNGTLAMGIISIVLSIVVAWGIFSLGPLILGVLAIVKGKQAISLYNDYPQDYTESSLKKAKAGFVCGIIGVSIWGVLKLLVIVLLPVIYAA